MVLRFSMKYRINEHNIETAKTMYKSGIKNLDSKQIQTQGIVKTMARIKYCHGNFTKAYLSTYIK